MVGWGGQLGGIQNQPGGFDEKRLVTLLLVYIPNNMLYDALKYAVKYPQNDGNNIGGLVTSDPNVYERSKSSDACFFQ